MDHRIAPGGNGLAWFQGSIRMIDRNPRGLVMVSLFFVLLQQVPNLLLALPDVSIGLSVLLMLLGPGLLGGLLFAIGEADAGRPVALSQLFEGLRRPGARGPLLLLGGLVLFSLLLIGMAAQRILGADNMAILMQVAGQKLAPDSIEAQQMLGPLLQTMMVAMVVLFVLLSGLFFAIPRVLFDGRHALAAFVESIVACAANVMSLTVYGLLMILACMALALALGIVAIVFGLLGKAGALLFGVVVVAVSAVVLLVSTSGNYLAWRDVFHGDLAGPSAHAGIVV